MAPSPPDGCPQLSVIMPVYNVEGYLEEAAGSVLGQSFRELELILVDDGSTDASGELCDELAGRDPRVVVVHQANGGLSAARNAGIALARGEYWTCVDSDDLIPPEAYARMMAQITSSGSDVVTGNVLRFRGAETWPSYLQTRSPHDTVLAGVTLRDQPTLINDATAWNKIFRTSFWREQGIEFPVGRLYEDMLPMARAFVAAKSIDVLPDGVYLWRVRLEGGSITQRNDRLENLTDRLFMMREILGLLRALDDPGELVRAFLAKAFDVDFAIYKDVFDDDADPERRRLWMAAVREFVDCMPDALDLPIGHDKRLRYALVAAGRMEDARRIKHWYTDRWYRLPVVAEDGDCQVDRAALPVDTTGLPDFLFRVHPELYAGVDVVEQLGHHLHVVGWGFIRWVDHAANQTVRVFLEGAGTRVEGRVNAHLSSRSGLRARYDELRDHEFSGFEAWFPDRALSRFPSGTALALVIAVECHGIRREDQLRLRDDRYARACGSVRLLDGRRAEVKATPGEPIGFSLVPARREQAGAAKLVRRAYAGLQQYLPVPTGAEPEPRLPKGRSVALIAAESPGGDAVELRLALRAGVEGIEIGWGRSRGSVREWVPVRREADGTGRVTLTVRPDAGPCGSAYPATAAYLVLVRTRTGAVSRLQAATSERLSRFPFRADLEHYYAEVDVLAVRNEVRLRLYRPLNLRERNGYWRRRWREEYRAEPIIENAIVCLTYRGEVFGDSAYPIARELRRRDPAKQIYWGIVNHSVPVAADVTPLIIHSEEWYRMVSRAKHVIINYGTAAGVARRDGQLVVETWHGAGMKFIGRSEHLHRRQREGRDFDPEAKREEAGAWSVLLSQNPLSTELLPKEFYFDGPVLNSGYPRNDALVGVTGEQVRQVRDRLGIPLDAKVLLYAPTWRDYLATGWNAPVYDALDPVTLSEQLGDEWVILVRGHAFNRAFAGKHRSARVFDFTRHPEVNDVILAADVLVTDYSSIMFDYSVTGRPIFFFTPDYDLYRNHRGAYFDLADHAPSPLLGTQEELVAELHRLDSYWQRYGERYREFNRYFAPWDDGRAAARVADWLEAHDGSR